MDNSPKTVDVTGADQNASILPDAGVHRLPANGKYSGYSKEEFYLLKEKLEKFKNGFIEYPRVTRIMEAIYRLIDWGNAGEGSNSPARCILVTGDSGSGKTATMEKVVYRYNMLAMGGSSKFPLLYVQLPSDCTPRWLAISILRAMEVPEEFAARGTLETLTKRVETYLVKRGIRLLILDEFHHLLKSSNKHVLLDVTEYIKSLLNTRACPIVMAGTRDAEQVYRSNIQIQRRSMGHYRLDPFDWRSEDDRQTFTDILEAFESKFPLPFDGVSLAAEGTAWRLHRMAEGNLGRVVDFLYALAARALYEHRTAVDYDLFRITADDLGSCEPDWVNPFTQTLPKDIPQSEQRMTKLRKGRRNIKPSDIAA